LPSAPPATKGAAPILRRSELNAVALVLAVPATPFFENVTVVPSITVEFKIESPIVYDTGAKTDKFLNAAAAGLNPPYVSFARKRKIIEFVDP
jgi:hypothetical protein